jgi:hypothetical protein
VVRDQRRDVEALGVGRTEAITWNSVPLPERSITKPLSSLAVSIQLN